MNNPVNANSRFCYFIAISTAVVTLITLFIAVFTPPLSGPFCEGSCFSYPYSDIASRFPRDYYWMFPSMLLSLLFLVLMVCVHHFADAGKKLFSQIGVSIAIISVMIIIVDYFVQVSVVQPSIINGETEGIALISQYNPHGVFIALEEIGYFLMCISLLSVVPVFSGKSGLKKAIRITLIMGFALAVVSFIMITLKYGLMREYIYEVTILSIVWLELIIASILMSRVFINRKKD